MEITLVTFAAKKNKQTTILEPHKELLTALSTHFTIRMLMADEIDRITPNDFVVSFVTIGGLESLLIKQIEALNRRPLILLADNYDNSLPTAIEASAWIRQHGFKCEIVYGANKDVVSELTVLYDCYMAQRSLIGKKIGLLGVTSSLLISSGIDYLLTKRRWGVEFMDISTDEVLARYKKIRTSDIKDEVTALMGCVNLCRECSPNDIVEAIRLYYAIVALCTDYGLDTISVNCYKILETIPVTACLALALMNNKGYVVGCEGDLQSIFTMLSVKAVTGKNSFMVNTNSIDKKENEVILSHCTVGTDMTETFDLRNHYATGKSVAIQGYLPAIDYTVVRCGGECLDQYFVSSAHLLENTNYTSFYRTQIRLKLNASTNYFLNNSLGNHHIIVPGDCAEKLDKFFQGNSCKKVE